MMKLSVYKMSMVHKFECSKAIIPTEQGNLTILPYHSDLITLTSAGQIELINDNHRHFVTITKSICHIQKNQIKIFCGQ